MPGIASPGQKNNIHSPPSGAIQKPAVQACETPYLRPSREILLLGFVRKLFEKHMVHHLKMLTVDTMHVPANKGRTNLTLVPPPVVSLHHTLAHFHISAQLTVRNFSLILHPPQQIFFFPLAIQPPVKTIHFQRMFTLLVEEFAQFHPASASIHHSIPHLHRSRF